MNSLVSIIIIAYNIEDLIANCILSCINQSYTNTEIIIVDDGSTDKTGSIIDLLQEKYPQKIVNIHQPNQGMARARLKGIKVSKGSYITFVDGDDELLKEGVERLVEKSKQSHYDITIGNVIYYDYQNKNRVIPQKKQPEISNKTEFIKFILNSGHHNVWGRLYKKEILLPEVIYPLYNMGEDYVLSLQWAYNITSIGVTDKRVYQYTINRPGSEMYNGRNNTIQTQHFLNFHHLIMILAFQNKIKGYEKEFTASICMHLYKFLLKSKPHKYNNEIKSLLLIANSSKHTIKGLQMLILLRLTPYSISVTQIILQMMQLIKPTLKYY